MNRLRGHQLVALSGVLALVVVAALPFDTKWWFIPVQIITVLLALFLWLPVWPVRAPIPLAATVCAIVATDVGWDGKLISLSTREFLLLEYLMRKHSDVCSREELLKSVRGYNFDPWTNVVDVYVRRLRTKLGQSVIETVRNVGYSYAAAA